MSAPCALPPALSQRFFCACASRIGPRVSDHACDVGRAERGRCHPGITRDSRQRCRAADASCVQALHDGGRRPRPALPRTMATGRRAAECLAQEPRGARRHASSPGCARWGLPLSGLHPPTLRRCAPHRALGGRWGHNARQPGVSKRVDHVPARDARCFIRFFNGTGALAALRRKSPLIHACTVWKRLRPKSSSESLRPCSSSQLRAPARPRRHCPAMRRPEGRR